MSLSGYHLYRCDRSRSGGGIGVYVAEYLPCSTLPYSPDKSGLEYLWLSINSFKSSRNRFTLGCFYRPPNLPTSSVDALCMNIESMLLSHSHVVACGDLNIDLLDTDHPHTKFLQKFILSHSLSCPITVPTRISASCCSVLDYFLCSSDIPISEASVLSCSISDHLPILLSIDWSTPFFKQKTVTKRSFKNFSRSAFNDDLVFDGYI